MSTDIVQSLPRLTAAERAVMALSSARSVEALKSLAAESADITTITNKDGYTQVDRMRIVLKKERVSIENLAESARADAVALSKAIIEQQKTRVACIKPEEQRLQQLQEAWDAEIQRKKDEAIAAEIARVKALQERVEELRGCQILTPSSGSELIQDHIGDLEAIPVDATFEEFRERAAEVKAAGLDRLRQLHAAALTHEAEQARIKAEREELARLRAEQAERDRLAAIEKAQQDAQEKAEREAQAKADREARAAQEAADKALRDAEQAKLNEARRELERQEREAHERQVAAAREHAQKIAADQARIDAERAELERLKKPIEVKPRVRPAPPIEDIIDLVRERYQVDRGMVLYWLSTYRFAEAAA